MKLSERLHHNLERYLTDMRSSSNNWKASYKVTQTYKNALVTECQHVITQSMIVNIGKVERNSEMRELYKTMVKTLIAAFDDFDEYIRSSGWQSDEIRLRARRYQQNCIHNIKAVISAVDYYYNDLKRMYPDKYLDSQRQSEEVVESLGNFVIKPEDLLYGTMAEKLSNNISVLEMLKGKNSVSLNDQKLLIKYSGWGGLPVVFNEDEAKFEEKRNLLKALLSKKEYEYCRAGTLCEHFTPYEVIQFIFDTVRKLGFTGGKVLDPATGTGNFLGLLPNSWQKDVTAVELNPLNAEIARRLYPKSKIITSPFEKAELQREYDLVVTNVPFGSYTVYDPEMTDKLLIHDYFVVKSLDLLNDGGIAALITTKGTLDKKSIKIREMIARRGQLLAAVRLPNSVFKASANTEATTDILFIQRRDGCNTNGYLNVIKNSEDIELNEYFIANPQHMLGHMEKGVGMHGVVTSKLVSNGDWKQDLSKVLINMTDDRISISKAEPKEPVVVMPENDLIIDIPDDVQVKNYGFCLVGKLIYQREGNKLHLKDLSGKKLERLKGMVRLKDYTLKLIDFMLTNASDGAVAEKRINFNKLYDRFKINHGHLNDKVNKGLIREDPDFPLLLSLEDKDRDNDKVFHKADIFSTRTVKREKEVTHVDSPEDAVVVSLNKYATLNIPYMARIASMESDALLKALEGKVFQIPGTDHYETESAYLSGDVKTKLDVAKAYVETDSKYQINVDALMKVQPEDLEPHEICFKLGSTWIPVKYYEQFIAHLYRIDQSYVSIEYIGTVSTYTVKVNKYLDSTKETSTYGTKRMKGISVIQHTLNQTDPKIYDTRLVDGQEKRELNKKETIIIRQKQDEIKELFSNWLFEDQVRRNDISEIYNDLFNRHRERVFDKKVLNYPGMNSSITLRSHQEASIERIVFDGNTLLGHCVGAGKTFTMIGAGMKLKQLGLAKKPIYVVPNHLIEDWATEFVRLYPTAKILAATKNDFKPLNRKRLFSRIATADWDAVIVAHSSFKKIPIGSEYVERTIHSELEVIENTILDLNVRNGRSSRVVKQLEAAKKRMQANLEELIKTKEKDDTITFEQMGIDYLFLDEAHEFKNLYIYTKQQVAGIPQTKSQKAFDMFMKTQYLTDTFGGGKRGLVFATGTPISNSMVEMYTLQRYLQMDLLRRTGLTTFDAWASTFGEKVTALEVSPDGSGFRMHTRFSKFVNLPELMTMFRQFADIKTHDDIVLPVPERNDIVIECQPTPELEEYIEILVARSELIHNGGVNPQDDNMLLVTNEGRKAALDLRLLIEDAEATNEYKVRKCAENVYRIWQETADHRMTQLVFSDLSTPSKNFNIYDELKQDLSRRGIPEDEVAFIHDANTDIRKAELFKSVRLGKVRVLIGSTAKMGAGMNVQDRLFAEHHLDCPWRPSDLEQREGRIIRQGNMLYSLGIAAEIYKYVTKGSFDAYSWQTIETKAKFINQIMRGDTTLRSTDDISDGTLSYSEIKAIASGNPLVMERTKVETELQRLDLMYVNYKRNRFTMEDKLQSIPNDISKYEEKIGRMQDDIKATRNPDTFHIILNSTPLNNKNAAGTILLDELDRLDYGSMTYLTDYRGFKLSVTKGAFESEMHIEGNTGSDYLVKTTTVPANNINNIDAVIDSIPDKIDELERTIAGLKDQLTTISEEVKQPFKYQEQYEHYRKRKQEIDTMISNNESVLMDEADTMAS